MTMKCFSLIAEVICKESFVEGVIGKVRQWIETFAGNDQEGALAFFMAEYSRIGQANR